MMAVSNEVRSMILERAPSHHLRQVAIKEGMVSLRTDGWRIVRDGRTTVDEVMRNTKDEETGIRFTPAPATVAPAAVAPAAVAPAAVAEGGQA
jgi:hypothetical protein